MGIIVEWTTKELERVNTNFKTVDNDLQALRKLIDALTARIKVLEEKEK